MENRLPPISSIPLPSEHAEWEPDLDALGSPITEGDMRVNDCTVCALRLDVSNNKTFCFHADFEPVGTSGKHIPMYPSTPIWCPGMLHEDDAVWEPVQPLPLPPKEST